ncbi:MAG: Uma2 family endonuclease [Cyanobacteria bacterium]|nr:Uma2 family endonuclease [Cyanobacteria bacterium CG_2015-16_32_12]NCO77327.1 Uma2 family endonuclease [Cyanobacteria bacterium CG_2015-22_32_23]NCQ05490.1 Uma2 family endonuclease [Cyanobacteria bacterium CG_2015-09_32_10]NCQ42209.1 Uma2 family endonuclease [Cyanobacteria bacterium CG_2015-04_32_10]NCS84174.1 Uma2 family endonuclease [Cyanobacteria bacterium CG_2015-02_32_10]
MVAQLAQKTYTITEYLEIETQGEFRHEFINGQMIPMAGGTTNHNEIITNLCLLIKPSLRQHKGKIYTENVRLWIPEYSIFTYPDVMVMAEEPIYYGENKTTVTNPIALMEVLSNSTRDYDLGRKFEYYRSLESLQEYVLIEPEKTLIMIYRRNNQKKWLLDILDTSTDILQLESAKIQMLLSDIYEGVLS